MPAVEFAIFPLPFRFILPLQDKEKKRQPLVDDIEPKPNRDITANLVMMDNKGGNSAISVHQPAMTDRKEASKAIIVGHQGHDGQKRFKQSNYCPSSISTNISTCTHFAFTRFMPLRFWPTLNLLIKN
ncbi:hypothetical protein J7I80_13120 [Bacillus sp. ISL-41]|uniref:hypothetical protein n=1 Tax=Bacillus sp. ISL-41 TaxID=2819127 RepID=UPI001BE78B84|nr:hypothetical protein [Bacillus sp. ISL-41]MBT2643174.1 hypothetical protein [Bacillus sp. ISL-41]